MNIIFTLASVTQLIAIVFLLWVAVENSRSFTLSKNSEWVMQNLEFKETFKNIPPTFILLAFGLVLISTIFYLATGAVEMAWVVKNSGIIAVLLIGVGFNSLKEKKIASRIPEQTVRTATLQKRKIEHYVPKFLKILSISSAGIVVVFNVVSYLFAKITVAAFTFDMLFALFVFGICFGTITYMVRKKEPHIKELQPMSRENISENYRTFSVRIMVGALLVFSILLLIFTAVQWGNSTLFITPAVSNVYSWFGETVPRALLSKYLWDAILSLLSAGLFVYMGSHKSLQDYRSSKLFS